VQLDFNYPLSKMLFHNLAIYFYAQFFTGYGETLLTYDQKDTAFRIGLGLTR
jgi:outer membrane phospholipase A